MTICKRCGAVCTGPVGDGPVLPSIQPETETALCCGTGCQAAAGTGTGRTDSLSPDADRVQAWQAMGWN